MAFLGTFLKCLMSPFRRNPPNDDSAQSSIYNPKEFRGRQDERTPQQPLRQRAPQRPAGKWSWRQIFARGLLWGLIFGLGTFGVRLWENSSRSKISNPIIAPSSPANSAPIPRPAPPPAPPPPQKTIVEPPMPPQPGALDVRRTAHGYVTTGAVNGVLIPLMVDTGASVLVLTKAQGQQAGIRCDRESEYSTANGKSVGCVGIAASLTFGPFKLTNVPVTVMPNAEGALLGMEVLRRFHMVWHGDMVRITAGQADKSPPPPAPVIAAPLLPTGASQRFGQAPYGTLYAPLKLIGNKEGKHCLVFLENWQTHAPALSVFVRSAETTEILVPLGQYKAKILCGEVWQGPQMLFGPDFTPEDVTYPLTFYRNANGGLTGMLVTLTRGDGANLK